MAYSSGGELPSTDPKIAAVKRQRVDARLVGEFEWSLYQRGYDGVRVDVVQPAWGATLVGFRPTQGGFEDAAGATINDITVLGGSVTIHPGAIVPGTEWQVFGFRYLDDRDVAARPDNSGRTAARVDAAINTFGTTLVAASVPRGGRQWDGLLWLVGQTGSWYDQRHRAFSVAVEAGHQWTSVPGRPWLRAGFLRASGDDDPGNDRHGTFFQMLPTVRRYSQTATYSQMNNTKICSCRRWFARAGRLGIRVDLHRVGLASSKDLWYFGSGATQSRGNAAGLLDAPFRRRRPARLDRGSLRRLCDCAALVAWRLRRDTAGGRKSCGGHFAGRTMTFGFLESAVQF